MKLLRKLTAFILVFSLFAGTVAMSCAAAEADHSPVLSDMRAILSARTSDMESGKTTLAETGTQSYTPRLSAPAYTNKYYYSNLNLFYKYGWGMPNCTCYAWGRAYEILGKEPDLCLYSAHLWYGYNKDNNLYSYGVKPKLGAIACWKYANIDSGHVAVVESIDNNTITFSNSAYSGTEFYLSTAPVNDPSNGNKTWIFQGYIYLGEYEGGAAYEHPANSVDESGDVYRITSSNGVNIRSGFGTVYSIVGAIAQDQEVTVTKYQESQGYTWGYTTYRGVSGWFVTDFAKPVQTESSGGAAQKPTSSPTNSTMTDAPILNPVVQPSTPVHTDPSPIVDPDEVPVLTTVDDPDDGDMIMMGDLDEDKMVTILDATRIQLILAELMAPTDYMLMVGDYDGDGIFGIMDSACIRYYLVFENV